jgi:hypothetical protein
MRIRARGIPGAACLLLTALLGMTIGLGVVHAQAQHVRWDIVHLDFTTAPPTVSEGGEAFAYARNAPTPATRLKIKLTGSGTFVAPASGGTSGSAKGGGTWETFNQAGVSTGRGTYWVTRLANWQFANYQTPGSLNDEIGDQSRAANGNAVLLIQYSDGSSGTLGIGCHGPGAPNGIVEGVIATKNYVTYWDAEDPVAGVDKNRTIFHVEK